MRGIVVMDNDAGDVRVIVDTRVHPRALEAAAAVSGLSERLLSPMGEQDTYRIFGGKRTGSTEERS